MQSKLFELFCCMRPAPVVTFQHTKVEYSAQTAYVDMFCYLDRSVINDGDYLCVDRKAKTQGKRYNISRIPIMRDPGGTSGVARVTFPNESGVYLVSYCSGDRILGETSIHIVSNNDSQFQSTFDTENCSFKDMFYLEKHLFDTKLINSEYQS